MKKISRNNTGFTLIEIIIVMLVMVIVVAYVAIKYSSNTSLRLNGAARQLANDIGYAQSQAMTSGQRYRFVETSSTTYQIQNNSGTAIPLPMGSATITLPSGMTMSLTNLPNNLINFDSNGVPYTDTAFPGTALASTATITLSFGGNSAAVSITPQTGKVSSP